MARLRELDPAVIVDKAIEVFGRGGFRGTSLSDLETATGVNRQSLYGAFSDKREIFLSALDEYTNRVLAQKTRDLTSQGPALEILRAFLKHYIDTALPPTGRTGCLLIQSAHELALDDAEVAQRVSKFLRRLEDLITSVVIRAEMNHEIAPGRDERVVARYLLSLAQGLRLTGKGDLTAEEADGIVDLALESLAKPTKRNVQ
jgi:TetR/AcrR family transcriptional repressor of nem operon